jgi:pimeloyl-ACP methyl ester carboxylesterase
MLAALAGLTLAAAGCTGPLAALMVSAPNRFNPLAGDKNPLPPIERWIADRHLWVHVGPPAATLSVSVIEPAGGRPPRGTVLVLHGVYARALTMLPQAKALSRAGYRAVLVDLRGHGRSTGEYLTYGVREAEDLSQVIDALEREGLVAGHVGVWGISYGATTAIHLAACDDRVHAVVAVEPFAMVHPAIRQFSNIFTPEISLFISEQQLRQAVDRAGAMAGFDADASDAVDAIERSSAPVLLVHGTGDWIVPYWNSVLLGRAATAPSRRVPIPGGGHASLWFDLDKGVSTQALAWFDRWL